MAKGNGWKDVPIGGVVDTPASAREYPTGKWRTNRPILDEEKCINCGACARVCPALSIEKTDTHHIISKKDCLTCMKCEVVCKPNAISYK